MVQPLTDWFDLPVPASGRIAAIADVHGHADLLKQAFEWVDATLPSDGEVVLLGDLIDRGPESLAALDLARAGCGSRTTTVLKGNHESMLSSALEMPNPDMAFGAMVLWARNGGSSVLDELGLGFVSRDELRAALGDDRVAFLKQMASHHRSGQVLYVHGGLNVERPLQPQLDASPDDFALVMEGEEKDSIRWIREGWVGLDRPLSETAIGEDLFVVYGHTIQRGVMLTRCQAGIDLGSFKTGHLCVCDIDHDRMRFVIAGPAPELAPSL